MDVDDSGYSDAMLEVVRRLAELERRPPDNVLSDLQHADADVIRVRVQGPGTESGELSFAADVSLREGTRRALMAAACSVINPARFHPRLSRTEAEELLAASRAGQTERGSYVLKVICPLNAVDVASGQLDLGSDGQAPAPFTRQVTRYLMLATRQLVARIENGRLEEYEEEPKESEVSLSSNLCDALVRMQSDRHDARVELSTSWAADRRVAPPLNVPSRVAIKPEYFREIEAVAKVLRPQQPAQEEMLIGTVERLSGSVGGDGHRSGEVEFNVLRDDEQLRVRANLTSEQYREALRVHERGDAYVKLRGTLRRGPRVSQLLPLRSIVGVDERDD